jgi:phosphoribosylformylglycinamidine synthase
VESTDLGAFDREGFFHVLYNGKTVAKLSLEFLHGGCPVLQLKAAWKGVPHVEAGRSPGGEVLESWQKNGKDWILKLLSRPNIASKEWLIRQYDHEVQGATVLKPLHQVEFGGQWRSGPNNGGAVRVRPDAETGVCVGLGMAPRLGDFDPYVMAELAVDEAVRNALSSGAEFGMPDSVMALVDNFCWPDPVQDEEKAAALVRTCYGMRKACLELGLPLISGKDSMKNDYRGKWRGKDVKISVPFTLLMTAIARVRDVRQVISSDFKHAGDRIYVLGPSQGAGLLGSQARDALDCSGVRARMPKPDYEQARRLYSWLGRTRGKEQDRLHSLHDVSEGGVLVSLFESAFARGLGIQVNSKLLNEVGDAWLEEALGEGFSRFVVSAAPESASALEAEWKSLGIEFQRWGVVTPYGRYEDGRVELSIETAHSAWKREGYWQ